MVAEEGAEHLPLDPTAKAVPDGDALSVVMDVPAAGGISAEALLPAEGEEVERSECHHRNRFGTVAAAVAVVATALEAVAVVDAVVARWASQV